MLLREALAAINSSILFKEEEQTKAGLFDEALSLLRRIHDLVPEEHLMDQGGRRGLVLMAKEVSPTEGKLLLREGLGDDTLPYGQGVSAQTSVANPEVKMALEGPHLFAELGETETPEERARRLAGAEATWGSDRVPCQPPRQPTAPPGAHLGRARSSGGGSAYPSPYGGPATARPAAARSRPGGDGACGGSRLFAPARVAPFCWDPELRLDLGGTMNPQVLHGLRASFGEALPPEFTYAIQPALVMALCRAYTGLANDMARVLVGAPASQRQMALDDLAAPNLMARLRQELAGASSETRSVVDMQALHMQALRAQAPPHRHAASPASSDAMPMGSTFGYPQAPRGRGQAPSSSGGAPSRGPSRGYAPPQSGGYAEAPYPPYRSPSPGRRDF